jgi:hypothetical protein
MVNVSRHDKMTCGHDMNTANVRAWRHNLGSRIARRERRSGFQVARNAQTKWPRHRYQAFAISISYRLRHLVDPE